MKITKKNIILLLALMLTTLAHAQASIGEKAKKDLIQKTSFGGYVIGKATITDQDLDASTKSHTDFDIRLVRAYVDGKVLDFKYKLQLELNGKPGDYANEKGVRIVDAWAEWQKYKFFYVRFGQFKRAFTFENPMNPWDIGFGYGNGIRTGTAAGTGRGHGVWRPADGIPPDSGISAFF